MLTTPDTDKITSRHREGRAYVYVRQSTPKQVQQHRESQRNQYALVQRAIALGWLPERVHVIDADLGQSGQDGGRRGFQELVAEVSLVRVGLILAYEASRLARNNADWYRLLDLAEEVFWGVEHAQVLVERWRRQYNEERPHSALGYRTPAEVAGQAADPAPAASTPMGSATTGECPGLTS